jgi:NADPH:quinone reductase-like Zn-dependent oxidoreductase
MLTSGADLVRPLIEVRNERMPIRLLIAVVGLSSLTMVCRTSLAADMRAAVVSGSTIHVRTVARPVAHAGQVLVKLAYAGVNPADWKRASGRPEDPKVGKPADARVPIPGLDGAGVIAAVGAGVSRFRVGDAVLLWSRTGASYAQYVAVSADDVASKPTGLSFSEAAGIPHASLAAWNLLNDVAKVRAGQTVLVLGGAGGVGSAAVQIANNRGAHVIATASARNADYLRKLGSQTVIDYTAQHFEDQLRNIDIAVNAVDVDNAYRALAVLKRGGILVSVAGLPTAAQCAARGVVCAERAPAGKPNYLVLEQIARWTQTGQFFVNIDRTFELQDVLQAWTYSQAGHTRGKIVLRIAE